MMYNTLSEQMNTIKEREAQHINALRAAHAAGRTYVYDSLGTPIACIGNVLDEYDALHAQLAAAAEARDTAQWESVEYNKARLEAIKERDDARREADAYRSSLSEYYDLGHWHGRGSPMSDDEPRRGPLNPIKEL